MRRSSWLCLLLLVISSMPAHAAATSPPGVNLRWENCYGDGGIWNKTFACDANTGSDRLVGSFELASAMPQVAGVEIYLDLSVPTATVPAWWTFKNVGSCRLSSLTMNGNVPPTSVGCLDWAQGAAAGGLASYTVASHGGPQTARITAGFAVPPTLLADLGPGQEYYAFSAVINHAKTVGSGACGGCDVPVCIFLARIKLATLPVAGEPSRDINIDQGANYVGSQYVTWQNGYPINVQRHCEFQNLFCSAHYTSFDCVLATPTNQRGSTWGQVKSLYR